MKGHTKIELTNVETGEVRTFEDDNMMTNALGMFVEQTGIINYNLFGIEKTLNMTNPLLTLARGLMLFESNINEDASIVYPPPGNKMVGQGSNVTYSGNNTLAGSYNNNESGEIENGYKFVWDFNTSQGNGQISCACLTSQCGGILGAGTDNLVSDWMSNAWAFSPYHQGSSYTNSYEAVNRTAISSISPGVGGALFLDAAHNCYYSFGVKPYENGWTTVNDMLKNKRLVIDKRRLPVNNISLFDSYKDNIPKLIERVTYDLPEEFVARYSEYLDKYSNSSSYMNKCVCLNEYNKHVYIYIHTQINPTTPSGNYTLPAGSTFLVLDLDVENKSLTSFEVTNTTGQTLTINSNNFYSGNPVYVTDKYVLMHVDDGSLYRISRDNNTNVKRLTLYDGTIVSFGVPSAYANILFFVEVGGKLYGGSAYPNKDTTRAFCIDIEEGVFQRWSCNSITFPGFYAANGAYYMNTFYVGGPISKMYGTKYGPIYASAPFVNSNTSVYYLQPFVFPHYLFTINNLDKPVVKTSAETMKVTYTIIDAAEY